MSGHLKKKKACIFKRRGAFWAHKRTGRGLLIFFSGGFFKFFDFLCEKEFHLFFYNIMGFFGFFGFGLVGLEGFFWAIRFGGGGKIYFGLCKRGLHFRQRGGGFCGHLFYKGGVGAGGTPTFRGGELGNIKGKKKKDNRKKKRILCFFGALEKAGGARLCFPQKKKKKRGLALLGV